MKLRKLNLGENSITHIAKQNMVNSLKQIRVSKQLLFNTRLIALLLFLLFFNKNNVKAQVYVNGPIAVFGTIVFMGNTYFTSTSFVELQDGSEVVLTGDSIFLEPGAEIYASIAPSLTGTGAFLFEGNSGRQILDGGNTSSLGSSQPLLINMVIDNPDGVALAGNNARLVGDLNFIDGHLYLQDHNMELAQGATITNPSAASYVVTNGSGFLVAEDIAASSSYFFPIGRAASDYTPATITNLSVGSDNYYARVKSYTESASNELTTADGVDRSWNIYSTNGTNARVALQHNDATNGSTFTNANGFVTRQNNALTADWAWGPPLVNTGTPSYDGAGTVAGSQVHSRGFVLLSTTASNDAAWFSKSSNPASPLPVSVDFKASLINSEDGLLKWQIIDASNVKNTEVYRSFDGKSWNKIGLVKHEQYTGTTLKSEFIDKKVFNNNNENQQVFYRLKFNYANLKTEYSPVRTLYRSMSGGEISVFPNPVQNNINIKLPAQWAEGNYRLEIFDKTGRQIFSKDIVKVSQSEFAVQLETATTLSDGSYVLRITGQGESRITKFIKSEATY